MSCYVVGWISRREWTSIYRELFSNDKGMQQHAVDRVAAWKARMLHKLPTAIECTADLVTAQLALSQHESGDAGGDLSVRLQLSMALVRFINLMTEKHQKNFTAIPVHRLAERMGLPDWLVELRHDATHSRLPSLVMCKHALSTALQWLDEEYWCVQLASHFGYESDDASDAADGDQEEGQADEEGESVGFPGKSGADAANVRLDRIMRDFWPLQRDIVVAMAAAEHPGSASRMSKELEELRVVIGDFERTLMSARVAFSELIAQFVGGYLPLSVQQLEDLGLDPVKILNIHYESCKGREKVTLPRVDDSLYANETVDESSKEQVEGVSENSLEPLVVEFWRPILKTIDRMNGTPILLEEIIRNVSAFPSPSNAQLIGWLTFIVREAQKHPRHHSTPSTSSTSKKQRDATADRPVLYRRGVNVRWRRMVLLVTKCPNRPLLSVLPVMLTLCKPRLGTNREKTLQDLVSSYVICFDPAPDVVGESEHSEEPSKSVSVLTENVKVKEMLQKIDEILSNQKRDSDSPPEQHEASTCTEDSDWTLATDVQWSYIPIGGIPGKTIHHTMLDLPARVNSL